MMIISNLFHINPKVSLFKNTSFWFGFLTPIFIGLLLGLNVWRNYDFDFSLDGYAIFMEISKLPFTVMSIAFPIIAIYMYEFKSKQNSLSLYNDLMDKIDKDFVESNRILCDIEFLVLRVRMHLSSFKTASSKNFSDKIRANQFNLINELWTKCLTNSDYVNFFNSNHESTYLVDSTFLGLSYVMNDESVNKNDLTRQISILDSTISHLDILHLQTKVSKADNIISNFNLIKNESILLGLSPDDYSKQIHEIEKKKSETEEEITKLKAQLKNEK